MFYIDIKTKFRIENMNLENKTFKIKLDKNHRLFYVWIILQHFCTDIASVKHH